MSYKADKWSFLMPDLRGERVQMRSEFERNGKGGIGCRRK